MKESNLPPGVTDAMIEAQAGIDNPWDVTVQEVLEGAQEAAENFGWTGERFPPGKHEGNPYCVPYFYEQAVLDGCGESIGIWEFLEIFPAEREVFRLPEDAVYVSIREDDNGFVHHQLWTQQQWEDYRETEVEPSHD